jgi:hypothetical protein
MPCSGEQVDQPFLYDAFISYRHVERDRKWAAWLIDALERFRVPQALQQRGLPPRLRKIFRDEDEVPASADLNDQIRQALLASRYLIVVCSAFTPRSKWVQREIEIFNELGRGDQVLALLTEGEPGDSFPAPMLERHRSVTEPDGGTRIVKEDKEPLAADVRPRPGVSERTQKRIALLRLVAVILGVKFDDLRQRDNERERKERITWAALAAVLCFVIGGGALAYWQMMQPSVAHYRQLVWRWGLPEGLGPIDAETRGHLQAHYSVTTQRGSLFEQPQVVEVRQENSAGTLHGNGDGEARWAVQRGPAKLAAKVEAFDSNNRLVLETYLEGGASANTLIASLKRDTVDFAQGVKLVIDTKQQGFDVKSDITRREYTLDDRGFVIRSRYQNHYGTPQHDANGSYGRNMVYSSDGLVLRSAEVGADGNEITLRTGIRATTFAYDSSFRLVRRTLIGSDEKPLEGPEGFACELLDYDRWGNLTKRIYCGADGKPARSKLGMAKITARYDERGNEVETEFFDVGDQPALGSYVYAGIRRSYDDRGNKIEESYIGVDRKPTLSKEGIAKITYQYNSSGREIARAFLDVDDRPVLITNGYAGFSQKYDARGDVVETAYFGLDGKPILSREQYAKKTSTYNARRQEVRTAYFDVVDRPTLTTDGYASITFAYDARGNFYRIELFDADNKPALNRQLGVAGWQFAYDDRGTITELDWFGIDGKPTLGNVASAGVHLLYDLHGNQSEYTLLGLDGKPILGKMGHAGYRQKFDARGNPIERDYLGVDGKPIVSTEGVAAITYAYDARSREIERAMFGLDGARVLLGDTGEASATGYAGYRQKFDDRGNLIETAYFGVDGKPKLNSENVAKIKNDFNARGQEVRRTYFDADDKPTLAIFGYAGLQQDVDARGNIVEQDYFGTDGEPVPIGLGYANVVYRHDSLGRELDATYFDAQGRPLAMDLLIVSVAHGSFAERIGLAAGDRIMNYDGRKPNSAKQLTDAVTDASGGQSRVLIVRRGSDELKFGVPPGRLGINIRMTPANTTGTSRQTNAPPPPQPAAQSPR